MANTVDGAEDAFDRGQHGIDARHGLAKTAIVVDQLGAMALGDLAQMRHLAVATADIENGAALQADLLRRLGRDDAARASYEAALALTTQDAERRFLERRLLEL